MSIMGIKYLVLGIRGTAVGLLGLYLILNTDYILPIHAATDSGVLSASSNSSPSGSISEKLEELKKEIASKAAQIKLEVSKKIENKAWAGTIRLKTDQKLTVVTNNIDREVIINEYTTFQTKTKGQGSIKDLAIGDQIIALGDVDDQNRLNAKKIIKQLTKPKHGTTEVIWGQIQSTTGNQLILKTKDGNFKSVTYIPNTIFKLGSGDGSITDVKTKRFAVVVGQKAQEEIQIRYVYIIPGAGYILPEKKVSTISGQASASAKPKN